jgi:hypothetical protein
MNRKDGKGGEVGKERNGVVLSGYVPVLPDLPVFPVVPVFRS